MEQFRDAFLDEDEYGFSSLSKFLARNKKRILQKKRKKIKPKKPYSKLGRKVSNRYAIIDPSNYEVVRFFDSIHQLENYTGLKLLYMRIRNYENYNVNSRAAPVIKGYIVVRWVDKEVLGLDLDDFVEFLHERARGWMIINQFDRIRKNIKSIDSVTLKRLYKYLE